MLEVNISYTSGTMAEFSTEELEAIGAALKDMNVKPKADSASDLKQWMVDYVTQMQGGGGNGGVKQEPGTGPATTSKLMTHHIPKVSCFSGDGSKQDTSYDLWRYEVDCLIKEKYSEEAIAQAIRRSLRGDAGKVAMRLGPEAKVDDILDKMESVFGSLERGEKVLEEFYSSTQRKDEDSMAWSCRLEEIFRKAVIKGVMNRYEANEKLKSRYWNGLHQWLKDISGYKYDQLTDFDELRKEVRLMEQEHSGKKTQSNMAVSTGGATGQSSDIQELKGMIQQLTTKVNQLEKGNQKGDDKSASGGKGQHGGYGTPQHRGDRQRGRGRGRGQQYDRRPQWHDDYYYDDNYDGYHDDQYDGQPGPICYRCGQEGHLAVGCRVILDHRRKPLNYGRPASRGRR